MKNVFILEDSKTAAHRLIRLLEKNGYVIVGIAETGPEAITKVLELKPDLVFADIILKSPEMDGTEAAIEIRKQINVPIIFTTNYSDEKLVEKALLASPYAYMLKPIDEDQLRVTLETTANRLRMEREREDLVDQLNQSQKMEAIGQLAGGMAHNFNNILSVILGNAELALKNLEPGSPNHIRIGKIVRSGGRAKDLSMKLLALARKEKPSFHSVSMNKIIEDTLDIIRDSISKKIAVETVLDEKIPPVTADANQIIQVILNICINACDSMPDGGGLSIESRRVFLDGRYCRDITGIKPGEYGLIRIQDTGTGIPANLKNRVFEPFFTTKEKNKGSGLGLYVTSNIIKSHDGHIDLDSEEGIGTTVSIFLPVSADASPQPIKAKAANARTGRNETILIVDDEEDFLDMVSETLQNSGYRTLVANSGSKALDLYARRRKDIDLVLLDIIMPEMDGAEVFHSLKKIAPDVKVVFCSGYSGRENISDLINSGAAFIHKPFDSSDLTNTISSVFESA